LEGRVPRVPICFLANSTPQSGNVTPDLRPQPRRKDQGLAELVPPTSSTLTRFCDPATNSSSDKFFLQYQVDWIYDTSHLRICEKGRQIGLSYADSYDSVRKVAPAEAKLPVWVMSRDELQAKQYLLYCKRWARALNYAAKDLGEVVVDRDRNLTALVLQFANGLCIYSLSSNPDAIVGKSGHVKLDEFALHRDQRTLYAVAKPVTQWGGTLSIISTHRGIGTVFNSLVTDIKQGGNRMGWSLHTVPIQRAVNEGLVEKINDAAKRTDTREEWLARQRAECIHEEQWLQEYCCIPADETQAFITYAMIQACETSENPHRDFAYLKNCGNPIRIGFDVARTTDLSVIDVEEQVSIDGVGLTFVERMRIEMRNKPFAEQRAEFDRLMTLPNTRAAIDASGIGAQLAEEAKERYGCHRVIPFKFTLQSKSDLAYPLRHAHEAGSVRYPIDDALRNDLRGIKKETLPGGAVRFVGESSDSHCDRFWAKALALFVGKTTGEMGAIVG
jgi:phage FluMu gp28-like protein